MINPDQVVDRSDPKRRKPRVRTVNDSPSLTVQSDLARADMKHILAKYEATGVLVGLGQVDLVYKDVSEFQDYADMQLQLAEAKAAFMRLPSKVREVFNHDVSNWLDAAHGQLSDVQRSALTELGVLEAVEDPADVPAVPAPPAAPATPPVS